MLRLSMRELARQLFFCMAIQRRRICGEISLRRFAQGTDAWPPTLSVWVNPAVQMDANIVSPTMCVISIRGLTRSTLARTSLLVTVGERPSRFTVPGGNRQR